MSDTKYDILGDRFGRLTVVQRLASDRNGNAVWLCECDCGNSTTATTAKMKTGRKVSCGCWRNRQNGHSRERLYVIWRGMMSRCNDPRHDHYMNYGGRGISVCEEWRSFLPFREWAIANGYTDEMSIDRIDNDGDYQPGNCRWVTQKAQCNNRSNNRRISYRGSTYTVTEFAEILNAPVYSIRNHLRAGWSVERMAEYHGGL